MVGSDWTFCDAELHGGDSVRPVIDVEFRTISSLLSLRHLAVIQSRTCSVCSGRVWRDRTTAGNLTHLALQRCCRTY